MHKMINFINATSPKGSHERFFCMYLCQDRLAEFHSFSFLRLKMYDLVVDFLIENNSVNIVKQTEQMSLMDGERYRA